MQPFYSRLLVVFAFSWVIATNTVSAQPIPPGSYQQTCHSIQLNGTTLRAICDGGLPYVETVLRYANFCNAPIENIQGNLVCPSMAVPSDSPVIPSGPYLSSCRNIQLLGGFYLHAACQGYMNNYVVTVLNLGMCKTISVINGQVTGGEIFNMGGKLMCY